MYGRPSFVGRGGELARFKRALAGETRLLLVVGDAGVGKTRFVAEAVRAAADEGVVAAWGNCLPLTEKLPLLPVVQALGELSRLRDGLLLAGALNSAPAYARAEMARLVPGLEPGRGDDGDAPAGGGAGGWQRDRLFSAVTDVLTGIAARSPASVVIEDVHWADNATLDCLTYLLRARDVGAVTVVATCRSDEAPLDKQVVSWLAHVRASALVAEMRLGPLNRAEVGDQVAALAGGPVPDKFGDEVFARAEGNPFFTEQLVTAALADNDPDGGVGGTNTGPGSAAGGARSGIRDPSGAGGMREVPSGLPVRLAELLLTRADRCGPDGQAVLAALSVAGRPLDEAALAAATGLDPAVVRRGLRELAAARLLAEPALVPAVSAEGRARDDASAGASRPRHALLAEAVAGALLPGERAVLHERTAAMLESAGDDTLAAEAAGHWRAAGQSDRELPARVTAGQAAERVFAYAEAAAHFQRAIALFEELAGLAAASATAASGDTARAASSPGIGLPGLYVRAVDALGIAGDSEQAAALAQEAYSRFAGHPDPGIAAAVIMRVAKFRMRSQPEAALELLQEAIRLAGNGPPSVAQAEALHCYGYVFLDTGAGDQEASRMAFQRVVEIAESIGATAWLSRGLIGLADHALNRNEASEALILSTRARALAEASADGEALLLAALEETWDLDYLGRMADAREAGLAALRAATRLGWQDSLRGVFLTARVLFMLIENGRAEEARTLIHPLTAGAPSLHGVYLHLCRAEADMVCGDVEAAQRRLRQVQAITVDQAGGFGGDISAPLLAAELALWTGRPREALAEVTRQLPRLSLPAMFTAGPLLIAGMRACADLAAAARARRDDAATADAMAAAAELASWIDRLAVTPFAGPPGLVLPGAERASWSAERSRLTGASDPAAWATAAKTWGGIERVYQAAYAWWRQAEALLDAGHPAAAAAPVLRTAAKAAEGHAPLQRQIQSLAERARIPLADPSAARGPGMETAPAQPDAADSRARHGLTDRELSVLRLLARGRTNAQIGAELYMSPKTASVHVVQHLPQAGRLRPGAGRLHRRASRLAGQPAPGQVPVRCEP